jgi:hypothetical protein
VPLLEGVVPRLLDDPGSRLAMTDEILRERVSRWPLVNLVHTLLAPLLTLVRTMGAKSAVPLQGAGSLVEYHLAGEGTGGWSVAGAVRSTFGQLRQSYPALSALYPHRKLWEDLPADQAARTLARRLTAGVERQRAAARDRLAGRRGVVAPTVRWLLTVGALLWFPIVQPVLQEWLANPFALAQWRLVLRAIVAVLGADYLLRSAGFLVIYYAVLWLALRWNTHRKVARMLSRWRVADDPNPDLNLATQCLQWVDELTDPVRKAHERTADLARRAETLRVTVGKAA